MISPKSLKRLHRRRGSALPTLNLAVLVLLEDTTLLALLRKRSHRNRLLISRCSLCWIVPRVNDRFLGPVGYVYIPLCALAMLCVYCMALGIPSTLLSWEVSSPRFLIFRLLPLFLYILLVHYSQYYSPSVFIIQWLRLFICFSAGSWR